jgi:dUTP pyrophosphatase
MVIDSDYRGPVIVALHNDTNDDQVIHNGDRIAQLVVMPFEEIYFQQVDKLDSTERGDGGFGSTGSN